MKPWRHHDVIPLKIFLKSQILIIWILFFKNRSKTSLTGPSKSKNRVFWKNFNFDPQWWRHQWVKIDPNPQNFFICPKWPHLPSMGSLGPRLRFWEGKVWKNSKIAKKWHQIFETGRVWPTVVPKRDELGRNRRRQKIRICQLVIVTKYQGPTINALEAVAKSP